MALPIRPIHRPQVLPEVVDLSDSLTLIPHDLDYSARGAWILEYQIIAKLNNLCRSDITVRGWCKARNHSSQVVSSIVHHRDDHALNLILFHDEWISACRRHVVDQYSDIQDVNTFL